MPAAHAESWKQILLDNPLSFVEVQGAYRACFWTQELGLWKERRKERRTAVVSSTMTPRNFAASSRAASVSKHASSKACWPSIPQCRGGSWNSRTAASRPSGNPQKPRSLAWTWSATTMMFLGFHSTCNPQHVMMYVRLMQWKHPCKIEPYLWTSFSRHDGGRSNGFPTGGRFLKFSWIMQFCTCSHSSVEKLCRGTGFMYALLSRSPAAGMKKKVTAPQTSRDLKPQCWPKGRETRTNHILVNFWWNGDQIQQCENGLLSHTAGLELSGRVARAFFLHLWHVNARFFGIYPWPRHVPIPSWGRHFHPTL